MDRVLIAGIGGGSLGLELAKCLTMAGNYLLFGADSSPYANGHYLPLFRETFVVPAEGFAAAILDHCKQREIQAVLPGGEVPTQLLTAARSTFAAVGIVLAGNTPEVVAVCSDKAALVRRLSELQIPAPSTLVLRSAFRHQPLPPLGLPPWVIKPALGTGGSRGVVLVGDEREAEGLIRSMLARGETVLVQDYISLEHPNGGEYTIGVLSVPAEEAPVSVVVMRRMFHSKLSVAAQTPEGLISSGISQGHIAPYSPLAAQAAEIACALGSQGPLNIQARLAPMGTLLPFEINPRFSSSTYLRCLAGINEPDLYLRAMLHGYVGRPGPVRSGYYLRALTELVVATPPA